MTEVRLQNYWCDSDPAGIVYFANFFRLVDQAEEELFLQSATHRQQLLDSYSVWMPRVEAHVNYVRPIRSGSAIRVRIDPRFKGEKTVRFGLGRDDRVKLVEIAWPSGVVQRLEDVAADRLIEITEPQR